MFMIISRCQVQAIKPIYEDPSKDELLQRCVRGFRQNNHESFNQNVWKVIPNNLPASFKTVSMGSDMEAWLNLYLGNMV